ncbi:hypothetical protein [Thermococcus sp. MAR1]|uniref:hypothetical protein n=1 Tax=Thermococcus sp. MAR1 TaxID=1638263 RepID=UPI001F0E8CDC|nr:hypothetical protein [Thermococcus sp. MAR1]
MAPLPWKSQHSGVSVELAPDKELISDWQQGSRGSLAENYVGVANPNPEVLPAVAGQDELFLPAAGGEGYSFCEGFLAAKLSIGVKIK